MRMNLRFVARAIDWPSDVLPTPGGPTRHTESGPSACVRAAAPQDIQDPLLDLLEAEVIGIQNFLGLAISLRTLVRFFHGTLTRPSM